MLWHHLDKPLVPELATAPTAISALVFRAAIGCRVLFAVAYPALRLVPDAGPQMALAFNVNSRWI